MTKHRTLRDALIGETVTVGKLAGEGPVRRRIMDMGVTKGTQIFIRKVAPLGDPIEVTVRGYELSIRKSEADIIHIHCFRLYYRTFPDFTARRAPIYQDKETIHEQHYHRPGGQPQLRENHAL